VGWNCDQCSTFLDGKDFPDHRSHDRQASRIQDEVIQDQQIRVRMSKRAQSFRISDAIRIVTAEKAVTTSGVRIMAQAIVAW
jgi:hypothetical protein